MKNAVAPFLLRTLIASAAISAISAGAAYIFFDSSAALSIAAGWLVSLTFAAVLSMTISRSFCGKCVQSGIAIAGIVIMAGIGASLWLMISKGYADPVFFMAGFSATIISLAIEMMRLKRKK
ncbi:MAG TPA: hypothetical protein PKU96_06565 [bacterium]|jgi:hypothetical protein|nr:hypothetical protein [Myxococcales bacterium]OQA62093.1 MAG: hypothetical protein BWY40_00273 [bacterium ADurb.Bin270]HPW46014.1 hypothetical protein [bacterium]HQG13025.1 hypothetical protein [bacterium]HQH79974.1 hypothetical protein [bacterium]